MDDRGPVHVAFDISPRALGNAGAGRYTRELAAALSREAGVTLERIGFAQERSGSVMRNAERAARAIAAYPFEIGRQASRAGAQVLHCPAPIIPVRTSLPLVVTIHDLMPWRHPEGYGRVALGRERLFTKRLVKSAKRVLVASRFMRDEVVDVLGVDPAKLAVVPHGVDARFHPQAPELAGRAHRFGIPPGPFVVWVGTAEPRKNVPTLIEAFELLRQRVRDVSLVMVGAWAESDIELDNRLSSMARSVIRPGFVTDTELAQLYSASQAFVFPSLYEGFGLPLLEAMACGSPVVASNVGGIPEVVGDAGVLVDPEDPGAFADALERVIEDASFAADMRQRGLERSHEFTWQQTAHGTAAQYREALAG